MTNLDKIEKYLKNEYDRVKVNFGNGPKVYATCFLNELDEKHWVTATPFYRGGEIAGYTVEAEALRQGSIFHKWEVGIIHV